MQDARMLLPGGARGRVLLRAGHQRLERLEERLDAHPRALPGLQERNAPEWKSLPDAEKAQYLLDHQTISDRTWTEESRLKGEKRDAFIHRILGFPKTP